MKNTKIKFTRVENASYKCHATYEWNCHIIECDNISFSGEQCRWYCDTLFKGRMFRTLKGLKHAIQLKVDNQLNNMLLNECEEE